MRDILTYFDTKSSNMDYKYNEGDELVFTGGFVQKNLNASKVIMIDRAIGMKPVMAFGNSGSDSSMLKYTLDNNKYPAEAYMLVADDNVRDWPNRDWEKKSADYKSQGFNPISMKNEFAQIYKDGVEKADTSETETKEAA